MYPNLTILTILNLTILPDPPRLLQVHSIQVQYEGQNFVTR